MRLQPPYGLLPAARGGGYTCEVTHRDCSDWLTLRGYADLTLIAGLPR